MTSRNTGASAAREVPVSQTETAYDAVLGMLLRLEIPPGAPIVEAQLLDEIGIGRTPLREALNRLEAEQLVKIYPRRGTFASEINLTDLALIADLREELEGLAAANAAVRSTPPEKDVLVELLGAVGEGDGLAQMELDARIHNAVYVAAHNRFLADVGRTYLNLSERIWRMFEQQQPELHEHIDHHGEMLRAIIDGDAVVAQTAARHHVRTFESAIRNLI
jgi:DNA-binding GntR family transcriptional regulator